MQQGALEVVAVCLFVCLFVVLLLFYFARLSPALRCILFNVRVLVWMVEKECPLYTRSNVHSFTCCRALFRQKRRKEKKKEKKKKKKRVAFPRFCEKATNN